MFIHLGVSCKPMSNLNIMQTGALLGCIIYFGVSLFLNVLRNQNGEFENKTEFNINHDLQQ